MFNCFAVGLGGFFGAVCRYLIGMIPVKEATLFPVKTFGINLLGCLLIGLIIMFAAKGSGIPPRLELFLKVGFCGGFTTFSTFAAETMTLMKNGHTGIAFLYVMLSVIIGTALIFATQMIES